LPLLPIFEKDKISNCFCPPCPVALTGNKTGQVTQHPKRQMIVTIFRNRRYRYPSKDWWLRTYSSGILLKFATQLNFPSGSSCDFSLHNSSVCFFTLNIRSTHSLWSVPRYVRGRYTRFVFAFVRITRKIPTNRIASAATGTKVERKLDAEDEVPACVPEPAFEVDYRRNVVSTCCTIRVAMRRFDSLFWKPTMKQRLTIVFALCQRVRKRDRDRNNQYI